MSWQTGFPMAIDYAEGAPRYVPERSMTALVDGASAALVVGDPADLPADLGTAFGTMSTVVIGPRASRSSFSTGVAIDTGIAGIHEGGTAYRQDEVPLPLRPPLPGPRSAAAALTSLLDALRGRGRTRMTTPPRLRIVGGAVHDPANGVDGDVRDVCIEDGRIVATLPPGAPTLDARGMVVMPGGVDIHSPFRQLERATTARRLIPDEHAADPARRARTRRRRPPARSGTGGTVPSTFTTGYRYAGLGYTTVVRRRGRAALARHSHARARRHADRRRRLLRAAWATTSICSARSPRANASGARDYAAWLLRSDRRLRDQDRQSGRRRGVEARQRDVTGLDDAGRAAATVTPRAILETLADAANALRLPHPVHIHCNNLGVAGNVRTTLASMRALAGRRAHFTHLQFHSYGGERGSAWSSAAARE